MLTATTYTTKEGERIDQIAMKAYGTLKTVFPDGTNPIDAILLANSDVQIYTEYPAGIKLYIPIVEDNIILNQNLPIWLR